jgi:hypothetical protein
MKFFKIFTMLTILGLLLTVTMPVGAQLGTTDVSSFTIQNIDTIDASVTVTFIAEDGTNYTPATLNSSKTNPFTLTPGQSFEIYVPGIPISSLPAGNYSVMVESTAKVAAISSISGQGSVNFNGSVSSFDTGASPFYLPAVVYNYYGWYSMISVQNITNAPSDISIAITCSNGTTGTLAATAVPALASHTFTLKNTRPTGFTASTVCNGSAVITATGPIVAVDNQSAPAGGNTQSYDGVASGGLTLFAPALYKNYYGWNSSINIIKVGSGNTTVTVTFSDTGSTTCDLTNTVPGCMVYIPTFHSGNGYFSATITSSTSLPIIAVVNAANGSQAQTYNAIDSGTEAVGIPSVMKSYYGWNTSFTCQNVGATSTSLHIEYAGHAANAYNTATLTTGQALEKVTPNESFLSAGYQGGVTVTANTVGANIACIVNFNNATQMASTVGDWSMSYNAINK